MALAPEGPPAAGGADDRIELVSGEVTVRVGAGFEAETLRRVLLVLRTLA